MYWEANPDSPGIRKEQKKKIMKRVISDNVTLSAQV